MKKFLNKKAFSLAETLIVIVILGIIASLIIRHLVFDQSKASTIALKRVYYALTNTLEDVVNNSFFYTYNSDDPRILEHPKILDSKNTKTQERIKNNVADILELSADDRTKLDKYSWLCYTTANRLQISRNNCSACYGEGSNTKLSFVTANNTAVFGLCGDPATMKEIYIYTDASKYKGDLESAVEDKTLQKSIDNNEDDYAYRLRIKPTGIIIPDDERAKKILLNEKLRQ